MEQEGYLILLAAVCFQANSRIQRKGQYTPPKGFRKVASLDSAEYPYLGFIVESRNEIIVAFRGSERFIDFITDLDWLQDPYPYVPNSGRTDRGFNKVYNSIREDLIYHLKQLSPNKVLYITGHSLGGAVATLAALDLAVNTSFTEPHVYTYASPRVGNRDFVESYNGIVKNSVRVFNISDIVPRLPPAEIPFSYRHVATRYPIHFQTFSIRGNHEIENYFNALCKMFKKLCVKICEQNPKLCPPKDNNLFLNMEHF